jgi:hypothetical protein
VLVWREGGRLSIGQERGGEVDLCEIDIDVVNVCEVVVLVHTLGVRRTPEAHRSARCPKTRHCFTMYTRPENDDEKRKA